MSTTEKTMTEKEAIELVTENGYQLHKVPVELRTKKVVDIAVAYGTNYEYIPNSMRTISHAIRFAPNYGNEPRDFHRTYNDNWGISESAFAALIKKGTIPNLKSVPLDKLEETKLAVFKHAFKKNAYALLETPVELIEKIVTADDITKIFNAENENNRWIGVELLALLPESIIEEAEDEIYKMVLNSFTRRDRSVVVNRLPESIISHEICLISAETRGYLEEIPVDYRTKEVCKVAVMKNGSSIKDVPAEFRKDFYLDAVMSGRGLSNIPEEDRTDRICTIAVDKNPQEFRYVPVDKRSYTLCMIAVDKNAENFEYVPEENIDNEMIVRFITAVLKKNYKSEFELTYNSGSLSIFSKAFSYITKEGMRRTEEMEAKENIMFEVFKRDPSLFPEFVNKQNERSQFLEFHGLLNMALCMIAVKGDTKNVSSIPYEFSQRVWKEYVQNHLK